MTIIVLLAVMAVLALSFVVAVSMTSAEGFALPQYDKQWLNDRYVEMMTGSMTESKETPPEYQNMNCVDLKFLHNNNVYITEHQEKRLTWCNADPVDRTPIAALRVD
jgi:hypothetical protein